MPAPPHCDGSSEDAGICTGTSVKVNTSRTSREDLEDRGQSQRRCLCFSTTSWKTGQQKSLLDVVTINQEFHFGHVKLEGTPSRHPGEMLCRSLHTSNLGIQMEDTQIREQ